MIAVYNLFGIKVRYKRKLPRAKPNGKKSGKIFIGEHCSDLISSKLEV